MKATEKILKTAWILSVLSLILVPLAAFAQGEVKVYYGMENSKVGVWLKRGVGPPEFLYKVKFIKDDLKPHVDFGEAPMILAPNMILEENRIVFVVNTRLRRDARLVLVIVKLGDDDEWDVVKELGVLEKRDFQMKIPPGSLKLVNLAITQKGKIRIRCPVEGIGKVVGKDGKVRFEDTGIRELTEELEP